LIISFVPTWDGIENLKNAMATNTIVKEQSAILVYGMDTSGADIDVDVEVATVGQVIVLGRESNVGWYYITDSTSSAIWDKTPSDHIWNAQSTKVRCS
jgi:hypothetical protein